MRFDELSNEKRGIVEKVAIQHGVEPSALWECYIETMESNFYMDVDDIARENEEYLKEHGFTEE